MCRFDALFRLLPVALAAGLLASAALAEDRGLGRPATAEEIAGWDIDVRPDGAGLPPGEGSVEEGEGVYEAHCAICHGTFGDSNEYLTLTGGIGSLGGNAPQSTVGSRLNHATTLFDYINRAMPFTHSKSLTADEVYAVTGYVLNLNDIVPADFVVNRSTLLEVKMPNRDGFEPFPGLSEVKGKPDTHNTACMRDCETEVEITGALPEGFTASMYGDITDNFRALTTMNHRAPPPGALPEAPGAAGPSAEAITQKAGCVACHAIDRQLVGPAFRAVAEKYQGDAGARAHLLEKIRAGGSGVWGVVPMPPQPGLSDEELATVTDWILAGAAEAP